LIFGVEDPHLLMRWERFQFGLGLTCENDPYLVIVAHGIMFQTGAFSRFDPG
jgi:hypothetical protein